jgi:hypothetical protein
MKIAKRSLYVEPTIPSYATAWDSKIPLTLSRQQMTRKFWDTERQKFDLYVSDYVYEECSDGDEKAAAKRINFIRGIEILHRTDEVEELADIYQKLLAIPDEAKMDCSHLAVCVLNRIDFLLTWNFTHLGPASYLKAKVYNDSRTLWTPVLVTPENIYSFIKEDKI